MKKKSILMLLATVLLSVNLWAANVAKVTNTADGTSVGEYATMSEALAAWTDGTTLTMLDNATYDASATYTVSGPRTLDLNGKTLTWNAAAAVDDAIDVNAGVDFTIKGDASSRGTLSFVCVSSKVQPYGVYAKAGATASVLTIQDVNIVADFPAYTSGGIVVGSKSSKSTTGFAIANVAFTVKNYVKNVVQMGSVLSNVTLSNTLTNVSITYSTEGDHKGECYKPTAINAQRPCVYENLSIDFSKISKVCCAIQPLNTAMQTIRGDKTAITLNQNTDSRVFEGASSSGFTFTLTIEDGVFVAPNMVYMTGISGLAGNTMTINGGKFSAALPYNVQTPAGQILQKGADGYYTLAAGTYMFAITKIGYPTADDCWKECADATAASPTMVKILVAGDFSIGKAYSDRYIRFNQTDNAAYSGTITNYAKVVLAQQKWDNLTIDNYGTLVLNELGFGESTAIYGDNFKINNHDGASVVVTNGLFTEKSIEQVGPYLEASGVVAALQSDGYYHIVKDVVYKVGETSYSFIDDALEASAKEKKPAVLQKDYTLLSRIALSALAGEAKLDLNGKTLTLAWDGSSLDNAKLTISNGTLLCTDKGEMFDLYGSDDPQATNYSVLTIAENVTVKVPAVDDETYFVGLGVTNTALRKDKMNGVVVNFNGSFEGQCPFYIQGGLTIPSDNAPTFNIGSTAKFISNSLAYAAGYGIWNYAGEATTSHHGFELRAGELKITGGKIVCTSDAPADDQGNGSGSTSQASAIAACQHSSKLPVEITVSGGEFEAYTPIYQANPQNNPQEAYEKVKITVIRGKFKAIKGSKNIVWSEDKRVTLSGGVYNLSPSQYVANDKVVVANDDETTKGEYPYTIADKVTDAVTFAIAGNWNEAGNWSNNSGATPATPVTIAADVTIPSGVAAQALGITVNEGKVITIKSGATLIVGNDGLSGIESANQLIINDGGVLVISPVATKGSQPFATAEKIITTHKKASYEAGESPWIRYYTGTVTTSQPTIVKDVDMGARQWNTTSSWSDVPSVEILSTPFKGYSITSDVAPSYPVQFKGQLVGNKDAKLVMNTDGFFFFANSWTAPMDAYEVLNQLDKLRNAGKVESAIKILIAEDCKIGGDDYNEGSFAEVTRTMLKMGDNAQYWGTIAPMAGFFLRSNEAVTIDLEYEKAVWNAQLAKKSSAPQRIQSSEEEAPATSVRIKLISDNGRQDRLYISDGEETGSSTKMWNEVPNVNIYVDNAGGKYSTYATETLLGTEIGIQCNASTAYTLSFDYAEGEALYLKDLATGIVTEMSEGNTYTFTAEPNTTSNRFRIVSRSEVTTGMEDLTTAETAIHARGIYSVTGQYLGTADQLPTLPAGVYIINGKKVVK